MDTLLLVIGGLLVAVAGAYDQVRCRRRHAAGKLPEDIQ